MNMDQFPGLSPAGKIFIGRKRRAAHICKTCGHVIGPGTVVIGTFEGIFGMSNPLYRYKLEDGSHADEFIQVASWSSGPCHFLGLRIDDGTELLWTDEEIEEWL